MRRSLALVAVFSLITILSGCTSGAASTVRPSPTPTAAPVSKVSGPVGNPAGTGAGPGRAAQAQPSSEPANSPVPAGTPGEVRVSPSDGAEMVYVPAGHYQQSGNNRQSADLNGFWIDKTEVTNERYRKFIDAGGYQKEEYWSDDAWKWLQASNITQPLYWNDPQYNAPDQPVVGVSWWEASAYAKWPGKRLATNYEWEFAARGGDGRLWPWGNDWDKSKANTYDGSAGKPLPVGSYLAGASPYGAPDMAGNV